VVCGNPGRAAVVAVGLEQTAAHLVDLVFLQVPVRQWVLSLPRRLRYFHHHQTRLVNLEPKLGFRVQLHGERTQLSYDPESVIVCFPLQSSDPWCAIVDKSTPLLNVLWLIQSATF